jgi:hypothetical protein
VKAPKREEKKKETKNEDTRLDFCHLLSDPMAFGVVDADNCWKIKDRAWYNSASECKGRSKPCGVLQDSIVRAEIAQQPIHQSSLRNRNRNRLHRVSSDLKNVSELPGDQEVEVIEHTLKKLLSISNRQGICYVECQLGARIELFCL